MAELCQLLPVSAEDTGTEIWDMGLGGWDTGWHIWLEGAWVNGQFPAHWGESPELHHEPTHFTSLNSQTEP